MNNFSETTLACMGADALSAHFLECTIHIGNVLDQLVQALIPDHGDLRWDDVKLRTVSSKNSVGIAHPKSCLLQLVDCKCVNSARWRLNLPDSNDPVG